MAVSLAFGMLFGYLHRADPGAADEWAGCSGGVEPAFVPRNRPSTTNDSDWEIREPQGDQYGWAADYETFGRCAAYPAHQEAGSCRQHHL